MIVVALALAIIFIRMPIVFLHPAFWGEDAPLYFQFSYLYGWRSVTTDATAGYLTLFQWLVGNTSTYFPVSVAPTIFNAASIALTLVVVWLVTSPRLSLPAKPLLALAVVTVPAAYEELATLANSQWIFPIGAFSILLMAPSKNKFVSAAEIAFVSIFSLTGPFSLLLLPVCGLQMVLNRDDATAQRRILILSAIVGCWCNDRMHLYIEEFCRGTYPRSGADTLILAIVGGFTDCPNNSSNWSCCASHAW